jgi:hypothetical protein
MKGTFTDISEQLKSTVCGFLTIDIMHFYGKYVACETKIQHGKWQNSEEAEYAQKQLIFLKNRITLRK